MVGAGPVGLRKVRALLAAGARVTVVAPAACEGVAGLAATRHIEWRPEPFHARHVADAFLVVSATGDPAVDDAVYRAASAANRPVNVVDDPARCSFIFPAIVDRSPVIVAVSSGGASPVLARLIRERLEALLPASLGQLAALAGRWRGRVKQRLAALSRRRRLWERVLDGEVADLVHAGRHIEAERAMGHALVAAAHDTAPAGRVWLVGAGPGDPGLLTLRALQVIQRADVILHDRLVSPEVLALARRDAERIEVGKSAGERSRGQDEINALLVAHARAGRRVCRLKGGDPFVFGRGGEELEALAAAGIGYEVVPGVTAAVGCAAYAGLPLTHRDHSAAVTLVTAHRREAIEALDWTRLARPGHTLAVYMGVGQVSSIRERLIAHGRDPATPVAFIENGTTPRQRVVETNLADMAADAARCRIVSPTLMVIGEVAALAPRLAWYGSGVSQGGARLSRRADTTADLPVLPGAAAASPARHAGADGRSGTTSPAPDASLPARTAAAG